MTENMAETDARIQEENNPFTAEAPMDSLGAGGRDVPEGQEEYYQERLQRARQGGSPMPETRPRAEKGSEGDENAASKKGGMQQLTPMSEEGIMKMNDEVNGWKAQGRVARKMEEIRQKRREQMVKSGVAAEGKIPGVKQYKRIKNIIRIIKLVSAAGSSFGDIFVSAGTFIITAHGELAYAKYINPKYLIDKWEKWLVYGVDMVILVNLLIVAVMLIVAYQMIENPSGALQFLS